MLTPQHSGVDKALTKGLLNALLALALMTLGQSPVNVVGNSCEFIASILQKKEDTSVVILVAFTNKRNSEILPIKKKSESHVVYMYSMYYVLAKNFHGSLFQLDALCKEVGQGQTVINQLLAKIPTVKMLLYLRAVLPKTNHAELKNHM